MNRKISFILTAVLSQIFLISCSNGHSKSTSGELREIVDTVPVISSKQILGKWEAQDKEMLNVDITANSFIYKEHHESDQYQLSSDSIIIYYPDFTLSGKSYLVKDTLVISTANGEIKFICQKK